MMVRFLALAAAWLFSQGSHACSLAPEAYDLEAALAAPDSTEQVFYGKVVSVGRTRLEDGWMLRSLVEVRRWYRGAPRARVWVISYLTQDGTSCSGAFNFDTEKGDETLFVARGSDGALRAAGLLSTLLVRNGKAVFDAGACVQGRLEDVPAQRIAQVGSCLAGAARAAELARLFPK